VPPSEAGDTVSISLFAATALAVLVTVTVVHRMLRR